MTKDEQEIKESIDLIKDNPNDAILMNLEFGEFVILGKQLFEVLAQNHVIKPKEEAPTEPEEKKEE